MIKIIKSTAKLSSNQVQTDDVLTGPGIARLMARKISLPLVCTLRKSCCVGINIT
jgi:hypothetical protein